MRLALLNEALGTQLGGFGVVFSDDTLHGLMDADVVTYKKIVEQFSYWGGIDTLIHGKNN